MLQCIAMCCSVLQCVTVCCGMLQPVAVFCSMLQCVAVCCSHVLHNVVPKCRKRETYETKEQKSTSCILFLMSFQKIFVVSF